jgi:FK506-binding protein 2
VFRSKTPAPKIHTHTQKTQPSQDVTELVVETTFKPATCTRKAKAGDNISVHYAGRLVDGTEFDSSFKRNQPFQFQLGSGMVIQGWDKGLEGACEGEKRKLTIPPSLGYGDSGAGGVIPGGATLVFDTELVKIN